MPSKKPLLHVVMDQELIDKLDEFHHDQRFPSRAAAVVWLLEWALKQGAMPSERPKRRRD